MKAYVDYYSRCLIQAQAAQLKVKHILHEAFQEKCMGKRDAKNLSIF